MRHYNKGRLGAFWRTSRGTDHYMSFQRSNFARDKEDLWKLLPDKTGMGGFMTPTFENPDDPRCIVYSCVTDSRAPPSIDTLYALKLLDEVGPGAAASRSKGLDTSHGSALRGLYL